LNRLKADVKNSELLILLVKGAHKNGANVL
jgi:hypothetical protein